MVMNEKYERILEKIINHYSKEQQVIQSIEEMSELTKELTKNINRGKENITEIKGEIADVMIMLSQLITIYGIDQDEVIEEMKMKLERQEKRIAEENR